ncbi:beta-galactosidase [Pelomonas aquatica]|uniref:Beta-galactosidase n=1 Tax=Pelomonas aquatica TaxID=431058 RepID=A0ABU1ZHX7_9BURK|nr:beta-galactosidase GalA [Pelomonas aquatica]MDR7299286.1 beta-galactosidase [Pelomonas aquatica]
MLRASSLFNWLVAACLAVLMLGTQAAQAAGHERLSLDAGWLFHRGDVPMPPIKGHGMSYHNGKANNGWGAAAADFDDSAWRRLDLPHDWAVESPFDRNENVSQGYRARGIAWYRRYLPLAEADRGRHIELQFDAIATHSTVWVNGIVVDRNWSGYNGRSIDITPYVRYGADVNTIAVRVDADAQEGWWYEGAGIYRHSWLVKRDALHIATDGLHANPVKQGGRWTIPVEVTLQSSAKAAREGVVDVVVTDPTGREVAKGSARARVGALDSAVARMKLDVRDPQLWSLAQPNVYRVRAVLRDGSKELDRTEVQTGFRTIRFDADRGFFLNEQSVKLQGVCIHQDHAGVGVAVPESIWEFRLRRLKEMGTNAIRFSHNAPAAEVLDMADRMGILVMDENRNFNPSPDYMKQLTWLVRRDRNHPSVILWSIFNEEPLQSTEAGYEMSRRMVAEIKKLDTTRPVTGAMHGGLTTDLNAADAIDVVGVNYQIGIYDHYHKKHPKRPLTSTEDTSAYMTRGEYVSDKTKQVFGSYDDEPSSWGNTHRQAWKAIGQRPFIAGSFIWTGIDYRGEPTPYQWPSAGSFFGAMDLAGFAKGAFWIHQAQWVKDRPVVKLQPHWNWAGQEGKNIRVMVTSNAERVRVVLNGTDVGEQAVDPYEMNFFQVPYAPGRIEAVALKDGKEVARDVVETTGAPVRLVLTPDRKALAGDGLDAVPITVSAVDAQGRSVPLAQNKVGFALEGQGAIIGVGNGDPNSHEPDKASERSLFNGLAQVIVQSSREGRGTLKLRASADGLQAAEVELALNAVAAPPQVPTAEPTTPMLGWRISPAAADRPDPNVVLAETDMNSWGWDEPPMRRGPEASPFRLYRSSVNVRADRNDGHGQLTFGSIAGKAEVWVDGTKLGEKTSAEPAPFAVTLPKGGSRREVTVLVEAAPGQPSGLWGRVVLERGAR